VHAATLNEQEYPVIEFKLDSMTCNHCVATVTQALKQADPNAQVKIDLASHQVTVESTKERAVLAQALNAAGYPPA
jgi:copper chaperone